MRKATKELRAAVQHIPGAWVRVYRDGSAWAGCRGEFVNWSVGGDKMRAVKRAIEDAGFRCGLNGAPGTSGEFIIDVSLTPLDLNQS
jgi:hypothetical protein